MLALAHGDNQLALFGKVGGCAAEHLCDKKGRVVRAALWLLFHTKTSMTRVIQHLHLRTFFSG